MNFEWVKISGGVCLLNKRYGRIDLESVLQPHKS